MKKFLPKSVKNPSGFTLVELLVVVAILAILAVIGFAVFSGLTKRGNDARRRADLKSISDALEVKKGVAATYQEVKAIDFTGGVFPKEPDTTTSRYAKYCYKGAATAIDNPSPWLVAAGACPDATWTNLDAATGIIPSATASYYKVCTLDGDQLAVICFASRQ